MRNSVRRVDGLVIIVPVCVSVGCGVVRDQSTRSFFPSFLVASALRSAAGVAGGISRRVFFFFFHFRPLMACIACVYLCEGV